MALVITEAVAEIASTANATSYAFGAFTPTAGACLVMMVFITGVPIATSVNQPPGFGDSVGNGAYITSSGMHLYWNPVPAATGSYNTNFRAMTFMAQVPPSPASTTPTIAVSAGGTGCVAFIFQITGNAVAIRQADFEQRTGSDPTLTFTNAMLTGNAYIAAFGMPRNPPASTPPTSWTEIGDTGYATPINGATAAYRVNGETGITITFTSASAAYGIIALELYESAIYEVRSGTNVEGTTSVAPVMPASVAVDDQLLLTVTNKYPTNGPSTPSGWSLIAQSSGGAGSPGVGSGNVYATVFQKIADSSDAAASGSGTVTVSIGSGNVALGVIQVYKKVDPAAQWNVTSFTTGSDTSSGTSYSATGAADISLIANDRILVLSGVNTADPYLNDLAITATGTTIGSAALAGYNYTSLGDDALHIVTDYNVISGPSSAAPVATMTGDVAIAGATVFVRIRAEIVVAGDSMDPWGIMGFFGV